MTALIDPLADAVPFVARKAELDNLAAAIEQRRSRLVLGPAGAGKTRLVHEALRASGQPALVHVRPRTLHQLLVELALNLRCRSARFDKVADATSMVLKGLVISAFRQNPRCVVLDNAAEADPRMYRFLQELYHTPGACLVVTARARDQLGYLRRLLWDPREEIALTSLNRANALRLFENAIDVYRVEGLELDDFRTKVLAAARGNPGQIVAMCRLAARTEYHFGRRIKFLPLRIDALTSFIL